MKSSYFVIEISSRWLTVLLAALAASLILAFAFGYGAAWSVLSAHPPLPPPVLPAPEPTSTPPPVATAQPEATVVAVPTATATPEPLPTEVPTVAPTRAPASVTPAPSKPTATAAATGLYWVQVLASSQRETLHQAGPKLVELGFGPKHQRVELSQTAGGELYKLRIGPFPDRASAERVVKRMRAAGFGDAWVVAP